MKRSLMRSAILGSLLVGLVLIAGCLTTKYSIISPDKAAVNKALVGNWNSADFDATGREAGLVVRNIDGKMYYAEWKQKGETSLVRGVGHTAEIKGATFIQLRGLEEDGSIEETWAIMRLDLSGNTLKIRQLKEEFFKTQKLDSNEQLQKVLGDNVNNEAMYAPSEVITATRAAK